MYECGYNWGGVMMKWDYIWGVNVGVELNLGGLCRSGVTIGGS